MTNAKETYIGYTFRADDAQTPNTIRYATVSHTALNCHNLRKSPANGYCKRPETREVPSCLFRLATIKYLKQIAFTSLKNIATMERPKLYSLVALVFQSSLLTISTRYSRTEYVEGVRYIPSTAVVMSEVIKVIICILIVAVTARKSLLCHMITLSNDVIRCCVPALLYTIQNNLQFVAISHLDAATFQVTYQLKILTTAVFSVCFLRRHLDKLHWFSLLLLTAGVAIVQFPKSLDCSTRQTGRCDEIDGHVPGVLVGVTSVLAMCVISGFAGVYAEKLLKSTSSPESLWLRNLQLALASVAIGAVGVYLNDGAAVNRSGFFQGYDTITWIVIFQQATLGLIVSLVMKYADNILKGFASSIAIVVTTVISSLVLHDLQLSCSFFIGAVVVMASTLLYSLDRDMDLRTSEIVI